MFKNKKMFYIAFVLIAVSAILSVTFPHNYPLGEAIFKSWGLSVRTEGGFHPVNIGILLGYLIGLVLLFYSLSKYRFGFIVIAFIAIAIPGYAVSFYQTTFAKGIYAVEYNGYDSMCKYTMKDSETLSFDCALEFKNHDKKDTEFTFEFYDPYDMNINYGSDDSDISIDILNEKGPFTVDLSGKGHETFKLKEDIDVSHMENYDVDGRIEEVNIRIKQGKRMREF